MNLEENWWIILISFILGNLSAGLLNWIKVVQEIKKLFKKKETSISVYNINDEYLGRNTNPRFGFSFKEPLNWDRFDPDNGDGYKYVLPNDGNVYFVVSGSHNVLEFSETEDYVNWKRNILEANKNFELIINRQSGKYLIDYPNKSTIHRENVKAWKMKYNTKEKGAQITVLNISILYDDITFDIHCQAPTERFVEFEDFFTKIIISFNLLGKNSAPHARSGIS